MYKTKKKRETKQDAATAFSFLLALSFCLSA